MDGLEIDRDPKEEAQGLVVADAIKPGNREYYDSSEEEEA
jgi:hypothetical protein